VPDRDPLTVCVELTRILDRLGIPYALGGSLASSLHGVPRSTDDADLAALLRIAHVRPLLDALEGRYYVDEERVRQAVRKRGSFNLIELASMIKIDLFVLGDGPSDRRELARRQRIALPETGEEIDVASAEDTILRKLSWFRAGGEVSDRQWRDVIGVIQVQGSALDRDDLAAGAELLDVSDLLRRALEEAESRDDSTPR
jgi:hypothetical protein